MYLVRLKNGDWVPLSTLRQGIKVGLWTFCTVTGNEFKPRVIIGEGQIVIYLKSNEDARLYADRLAALANKGDPSPYDMEYVSSLSYC